ncbi:hypothetical protein B2G44_01205 [Candidatus Phytoplasma citri]|uniref:Uncharacterized protein n=1 Tax=Candidatus Phytoplasma citri TaxID=180978 RepID=A0A1S9M1H6_9MOLU|nr:hypothetical protein B2G44_01205 [Candidatus Phytoplasma aurantifolia]
MYIKILIRNIDTKKATKKPKNPPIIFPTIPEKILIKKRQTTKKIITNNKSNTFIEINPYYKNKNIILINILKLDI